MKIIWTEKGLAILRFIFKLFIIAASIAFTVGFVLVIGGAGAFDYEAETGVRLTEAETLNVIKSIAVGTILFVVSFLVIKFCGTINAAIDNELQRRHEIAKAKRRKALAAKRPPADEYQEYKRMLERYGSAEAKKSAAG